MSEFGHTDGTMHVRTLLGSVLKPGDTALGYDLQSANYNTAEVDSYGGSIDLPDVVLVRKSYAEKRRRRKNRARPWQLKQLGNKGQMDTDEDAHGDGAEGAKNKSKSSRRQGAAEAAMEEQRQRDMERFMEELEEDPELRSRINLYRRSEGHAGGASGAGGAVDDDDYDDESDGDGVPEVPLEELLDSLTALNVSDASGGGGGPAPSGAGSGDMDM